MDRSSLYSGKMVIHDSTSRGLGVQPPGTRKPIYRTELPYSKCNRHLVNKKFHPNIRNFLIFLNFDADICSPAELLGYGIMITKLSGELEWVSLENIPIVNYVYDHRTAVIFQNDQLPWWRNLPKHGLGKKLRLGCGWGSGVTTGPTDPASGGGTLGGAF